MAYTDQWTYRTKQANSKPRDIAKIIHSKLSNEANFRQIGRTGRFAWKPPPKLNHDERVIRNIVRHTFHYKACSVLPGIVE